MDMLALAAAGTIVLTVLAFALSLSTASNAQIRGRLEDVLSGTTSVLEIPSIDPLRRARSASMFGRLVSAASMAKLQHDLRRADSQLQPVDFISIRLAMAGLGFALPYLFLSGIVGILLGAAAALVGFIAPAWWLNQRKQNRNKKLEEQLPDALTMIANSLKAGFGLMQAMSLAGEQLEHPISTELKQTVHETNVGSSTEEAFLALSERTNSYDLDLVVTAILVQRSAGGNLAEILQTVTETMRERVRIRGEITTLTAQQTMTGYVIALLPVGVGGMFMVVSPDYITVLFTENMGRIMLGVAGLLEVIGVVVIRRILAIEV